MNEWVAFGIVAVICGLLAVLVRFAGAGDPPSDGPAGDDGAADDRGASAASSEAPSRATPR